MYNIIRGKVSKQKRRFHGDEFDLDLSYITDQVVAMGFPSENVEGIYRNRMSTVQAFFNKRHPAPHHLIINLCEERGYEESKFGNCCHFPFYDHNPCPFPMIIDSCNKISNFLNENPRNVVGVHCKAGKGRTGLIISSWLIFAKICANANDALRYFAEKRTIDGKGVTIPSQIRYVHYFDKYFHGTIEYQQLTDAPKLRLIYIRFFSLPCSISPKDLRLWMEKRKSGKDILSNFPGRELISNNEVVENAAELYFKMNEKEETILQEDFRVKVKLVSSLSQSKLLTFWVNTRFISNIVPLTLLKNDVDMKRNRKQFPEEFRVELMFGKFSP
mmetsp:Transcript_6532/g.14121  ORF Transcript_6532/g.14121 Transcript_6532/m.14121 type:complete len:330 (-) Transcript_6532:371-1360(-)|eukprot:CAMPEP_0113308228 /NCGR_PEP_ID=MMETSP0010_2-20120614/6747_1 /TAXON_ID=216773 ORGANISM="Corethron hystrix, Strain 308" /NCGR_SAMPLE_ID=MMETSP0010_2 /ASSEMBLY_ACC=CAM_ASM_000155 /LENGTH=329 /DNA_ID=CAMNT_0000163221 /DNA_START=184 /DNA_END=1173 /DNA_ORIENTATION=+ /assembly_acc=CAM_ASM_000155